MGRKSRKQNQNVIVRADYESLDDSLVNGHSGWSPTISLCSELDSVNMEIQMSHVTQRNYYSESHSNQKGCGHSGPDFGVWPPQKGITCEDKNRRNMQLMFCEMNAVQAEDLTSVKERMFKTSLLEDEMLRRIAGLKFGSLEESSPSADLNSWHRYRDAENERRRNAFGIDNLEQCQDNSLPLICYSREQETGVKGIFSQDEFGDEEKGSRDAESTKKEQNMPSEGETRDNKEDHQITKASAKQQEVRALAVINAAPFRSSGEIKSKTNRVKLSDKKHSLKLWSDSYSQLQLWGIRRRIPHLDTKQGHLDVSIWLICRRHPIRGQRKVSVGLSAFRCLAGRQCPGGCGQGNGPRGFYSKCGDGGGGGCGATGGFDRSGCNSMPNGGSGGQGGGGDGDRWKQENLCKNSGKRKSEEDEKQKSKKILEAGILAWLMIGNSAVGNDEKSIIFECLLMCLSNSNGHSNCNICDALILQLKHCSRKCNEDKNHCDVCSRVFHLVTEFSRHRHDVGSCLGEGQCSDNCSPVATAACSSSLSVASQCPNHCSSSVMHSIPGADLHDGASLSDVRSFLQSKFLDVDLAGNDSDKDNNDDDDEDSDRDVPNGNDSDSDTDKENSKSKAATAEHESTVVVRGGELSAQLSNPTGSSATRYNLSRSSSEESIVMPSFEDEEDELHPLPERTDHRRQTRFGVSGRAAARLLVGVSSTLTDGEQSDLPLSVPTTVSRRNVYHTDGGPTSLPAGSSTKRTDHSSLQFLHQAGTSPPAGASGGGSSLGTSSVTAWGTSVGASRVDSTSRQEASASSINSISPLNGPRVCMSEAFPGGAANLLDGSTMWSMPLGTRRRGQISYGSKGDLRGMAHLWHNCAERARQDGSYNLRHLPVAGIILNSARKIMCIVNGNYDEDYEWTSVSEPLGCGVAGKCHSAIDYGRKASFCVKKIHLLNFSADELIVWSDLEHPDVVKLFGAMVVKEHVFIFQELIQGPTLREWISDNTALNSYIALQLLQNLLQILQYLKSRRVIHDDIKADNLMLRRSSLRVVMIDFGLSRNTDFVSVDVNPTGGQTHWSPEKAASEGYDFGADLWAAVAVFVHMLSGNEPWIVRFKQAGMLHYIIKGSSPPLQDIPAGIPDIIHNLICRGWTVNTSERPTVDQLLRHEAFTLLGTMQPDSEFFRRHLPATSSDASATVSDPQVLWVDDDLETETLISRAEELSVQLRSGAFLLNLEAIEEPLVPTEEPLALEAAAAFIDIQHPGQSLGNRTAAATTNDEIRELLNETEQSMSLLRIASESFFMEARQRKVTFQAESESSEEANGSEGEAEDEDEDDDAEDARHESVGFVASVAFNELRCEESDGQAVLRLSPSQIEAISREFSRRQASMPEKRSTNDVVQLSSQASAPAMLESNRAEPLSLQQRARGGDSHPFTSMPCPRPEIPEVSSPVVPENSSPVRIEPAAGAVEMSDMERREWEHLGARPKVFPASQPNPKPPMPNDSSMESYGGLIPAHVLNMSVSDDEDTQDSQPDVVWNASTESCIEATLTGEAFAAAFVPDHQPPVVPESPSDLPVISGSPSDLSLISVPENAGASLTLREELQHQFPYSASDNSLLMSSSIGTTVTVYHDNTVVYRAHLHPGPEHRWSEVLLRASNAIHQRGVLEFTAEWVHTDRPSDPIDVDTEVPPEGHVIVNLLPVLGNWIWKIEDSRISYHPGYHGQFGPRMDD